MSAAEGWTLITQKKYRAFISYSHADEAWGGWLQRSLERFRAPSSLGRGLNESGSDARLAPVFRDREDLAAAGDLTAAIRQALADSAFQIVLCSPRAAQSRWVNEEIKLFHKLNGPGRTFAIIIDGKPGASDIPGREAEECLPSALRFRLDADGNLTGEPAEPLAADARESGDGKRNALLKIAAAMLGVSPDEIVGRDAQRRRRLFHLAAAGAMTIIAALSALTVYAFDQRRYALAQQLAADSERKEAERQQQEAEKLIDFMLTDLKDKLEPVGKLDILQSVGDKVLDYYAHQDLEKLGDDAQARRAKALIQLGQIEQTRGEYSTARNSFEAAFNSTKRLLDQDPGDAQRIFDHAQSVFYLGDLARHSGEYVRSQNFFDEYYSMAQKLVGIDPANRKWRLEESYALSNIGINYFGRGEFAVARSYMKRSVETRQSLFAEDPDSRSMALSYAYSLSWLALNDLKAGLYNSACNTFDRQISIYESMLSQSPDDQDILFTLMLAKQRRGQAKFLSGDISTAKILLDEAVKVAVRLRSVIHPMRSIARMSE
ncbi:MAG: toll/interleukin-1 receptor domain-containing protein [Parvularculaceae bacterium]